VGTNLELFNGASLVATERLAHSYTADTQVIVQHSSPTGTGIFFSSSAACYVAGTRILTADGERNVEDLREGDIVIVLTEQGQTAEPVKWIGYRTVDLSRQPHHDLAAPIRVLRNAIGENRPHRTCWFRPITAFSWTAG
jgi:hypothetical protein